MANKLNEIRREYLTGKLSRRDLPDDPMVLVERWVAEAVSAGVKEPTAMIVATATTDACPSIRTVLLKEIRRGELLFYTNYESRKGQQIEANDRVAVSFLWHDMERQIHIEGVASKVSEKESDDYFCLRPYRSRIGARISPQSRAIPSREYLMALFAAESLRYVGRSVPRPLWWGGYAIRPKRVEFWQGRESRLHDRFLFVLEGDLWRVERLAP